jgi:hypothetical protein
MPSCVKPHDDRILPCGSGRGHRCKVPVRATPRSIQSSLAPSSKRVARLRGQKDCRWSRGRLLRVVKRKPWSGSVRFPAYDQSNHIVGTGTRSIYPLPSWLPSLPRQANAPAQLLERPEPRSGHWACSVDHLVGAQQEGRRDPWLLYPPELSLILPFPG